MSPEGTLPIHCVGCGASLLLHLEGWQATNSHYLLAALVDQQLVCPACHKVQPLSLPGTVVRVTLRPIED